MKIRNKALVLTLSAMVLSGCSTTMTIKTVTKPNGEVVVIKEYRTSKNHSVVKAVQTAATVFLLHKIDRSGVLLSTANQFNNDKKSLEFEREKYHFEKKQEREKQEKKTVNI